MRYINKGARARDRENYTAAASAEDIWLVARLKANESRPQITARECLNKHASAQITISPMHTSNNWLRIFSGTNITR